MMAPTIADPFAVIPIKPDDVEMKRDSRGCIHLRRCEVLPGLRGRLAAWIGYDCSRKVELDQHGTLYYGLADGTNTLRAIAERMAVESGQPMQAVEEGVILFTKKLMTMNMIALKVPVSREGME